MSKNRFAVVIYVSCGLSTESCGVLRFSGIPCAGLVSGPWTTDRVELCRPRESGVDS